MRVDLVHQRDPDSECYNTIYVDGVEVEFKEWSFDPGAGYDMDDDEDGFEEMKRDDIATAPDFLKPVIEEIYNEMEPTYERWSL